MRYRWATPRPGGPGRSATSSGPRRPSLLQDRLRVGHDPLSEPEDDGQALVRTEARLGEDGGRAIGLLLGAGQVRTERTGEAGRLVDPPGDGDLDRGLVDGD